MECRGDLGQWSAWGTWGKARAMSLLWKGTFTMEMVVGIAEAGSLGGAEAGPVDCRMRRAHWRRRSGAEGMGVSGRVRRSAGCKVFRSEG